MVGSIANIIPIKVKNKDYIHKCLFKKYTINIPFNFRKKKIILFALDTQLLK